MTIAVAGSPKPDEYITIIGLASLKGYESIDSNSIISLMTLSNRKIKVDISSMVFNDSTTTEILLLKFDDLDPTSSLGGLSSCLLSSFCWNQPFEYHIHDNCLVENATIVDSQSRDFCTETKYHPTYLSVFTAAIILILSISHESIDIFSTVWR